MWDPVGYALQERRWTGYPSELGENVRIQSITGCGGAKHCWEHKQWTGGFYFLIKTCAALSSVAEVYTSTVLVVTFLKYY